MSYFDDPHNVKEYIKMCKDSDSKDIIDILKKHLKKGSTVLELGMGPGKDLDLLNEYYNVTGSDNSQVFLDLYKANHKNSELLFLDAVTINTKKHFDCIYTNKVLHHLTKEDLIQSVKRQNEVLDDNGLLFHTFWRGNSEEIFDGLRFIYYEKEQLIDIFSKYFIVVDIKYYTELGDNDSIYIILEKNK